MAFVTRPMSSPTWMRCTPPPGAARQSTASAAASAAIATERRAARSERHQAAAEAASDLERHREREAAAHGMTFEEYLKATDAWPMCKGTPDPIEVAALKARLAAGGAPGS